jgi:hypothetical protein
MKEVYAACTRDLVWTGPNDRTIEAGRQAMQRLGRLSKLDRSTGDLYRHRNDKASADATRRLQIEAVTDLQPLLLWPKVWRRIWVIQELAFAREITLIAGHAALPWLQVDEWLDTQDYVRRHGLPDVYHEPRSHSSNLPREIWDLIRHVRILSHQRHAVQTAGREELEVEATKGRFGRSLKDTLARFRHAEATDARDKIYGLLGLCDNALRPNYRLQAREVFIDCTLALLKQDMSLDMLCQGPWELMGNQRRARDVPSWCADFACPGTSRILFAQRNIFRAGLAYLEQPLEVDPTGCLALDATLVDRLAVVRRARLDFLERDDTMRSGRDWMLWAPNPIRKTLLANSADDKVLGEVLHLSLKDNNEPDPSNSNTPYPDLNQVELYFRSLKLDCVRFPGEPTRRLGPSDLERMRPVFHKCLTSHHESAFTGTVYEHWVAQWIGQVCEDWVLAISEKGLYCMVPHKAAEKGDVIAVLPGAKVPVLLREHSEQKGRSLWVGACYMHVLMDGGDLWPESVKGRRGKVEIV